MSDSILQFILNCIIAMETTMVLRTTGARWLATMMRAERDDDDWPGDDAWLLFGPSDPAVVERREPPTHE
ncbi:hypothetical protein [Burkholderia cenocepacia]